MTVVPFSLNETVRVRLTDHGRRMLRKDHHKFWAGVPGNMPEFKLVENDGWSEWPLWELMHAIGKYQVMGNEAVVEMKIELKVPSDL